MAEQSPAYVAVYELIDSLGDSLPRDVAERDALMLQAAEAAVWAFAGAENEGAWESFAPFVAKEFWDLFPDSFVEAAHADLCYPVCHQNLMECVENALRAYWADSYARPDLKEG